MVSVPGYNDDQFTQRTLWLASLIRQVWRSIAKNTFAALTKQGTITLSDAGQVRTAWADLLPETVLGHIRETYLDGAAVIVDAVGGGELIGDDPVEAYLANARNRLVGVGDHVWQNVRAQIQLGINAGESVEDIAARVRNVANVSSQRSLAIARTETHAAYEAGSHAQALFVDPDATKTWLATADSQTRETHKLADGQTVKISESFTVGTSSLRFPGDPLGAPGEVIQCRCSTSYEFGDTASVVNDDVTSDQELVLAAAAGKWNPQAHPRGNDGKFIKKGAVVDLLSAKKPTIQNVANAAADLTPESWKQLTAEQKLYLIKSMEKLPDGSIKSDAYADFAKAVGDYPSMAKVDAEDELTSSKKSSTKSTAPKPSVPETLADVKLSDYDTHEVITHDPVSGHYAEKISSGSFIIYDADGVDLETVTLDKYLTVEDVLADYSDDWVPDTPKSAQSPSPATGPNQTTTPTQTTVPAGLKGKPGDPAKVTTGVIWGKHEPGTVVLEDGNGNSRVVWDGKKYQIQDKNASGTWSTFDSLTKKDTYATLKNNTHWVIPSGSQSAVESPTTPSSPTAPTAPYTPATLTPAQKTSLLFDLSDGLLSQSETADLVHNLTLDDVSALSANQKKNISDKLQTGSLNKSIKEASQEALATWEALLKTADKQQITDVDTPGGSTGKTMTTDDFVDVFNDSHKLHTGYVVAVSPDGNQRIVWSDIVGGFVVEEKDLQSDEWLSADSWSLENVNSMHESESSITDMLDDWSVYSNTWVMTDAGDPPDTVGNEPDVPILTNKDLISNWPGVVGKKYSPGEVVALTQDGTLKIKAGDKSGVFHVVAVSKWANVESSLMTFTKSSMSDYTTAQLNQLSSTWVVPPKKNADLPSQQELSDTVLSPTTKNVVDKALADGEIGDVIATASIDDMTEFVYRAVVVEHPTTGKKSVKLESSTDSGETFYTLGVYDSYEALGSDWSAAKFNWTWVNDKLDPVTPAGPAQPKNGPTKAPASAADVFDAPATPVTAPPVKPPVTVQNGDDISGIPQHVKNQFKATLKATPGNVGYWSKPEKIWDVVKDVQAKYPDPNNPGSSLYTPAQILKTLDTTTNTKTSPNPYSDKIAKWAATAKGKSYTGGTGAANPMAIGQPKPIEQVVAEVYQSTKKSPTGGVLFTSQPGSGTNWQLIDSTMPGNSEPHFTLMMESKKDGWMAYKTVSSQKDLENTVINFSLKPTASSGQPLGQTSLPTGEAEVAHLLDPKNGDISGLSESHKQTVYSEFKKMPSTYLDSPDKDIFLALKTISSNNGLSLLQALRIIDDVGAKKVNAPNAYLFEKKISTWLTTPQGAAVALNKPIPKPARPDFKLGVSTAGIPSFTASSQYTYNTISPQQATDQWSKITAQHGDWTAGERAGLRAYTGGIFYSINGYLYGQYDTISPTNQKAMVNSQKGMRPSVAPILLHRGVGFDGIANSTGHADLASKVGQVWKGEGFASTSVGGSAAFGHKPVIAEIEVPPGTPMAWLKPISKFNTENEMLLAAGLNYKIISVKKVGTRTVVRMRVVPDEEA